MILADAHVHIYDCFDLEQFFDAALLNFRTEVGRQQEELQNCLFFLLLTEGPQQNWFQKVSSQAEAGNIQFGKWFVQQTTEKICLLVCHDSYPDAKIYLVAGHQIETIEKLEVLALFSDCFFENGMSLENTVENIKNKGAIPGIPWGTGKWFGKRGRILRNFLKQSQGDGIFIGDSGVRPVFWPTPDLFHFAKSKGVMILPGSDPLPIQRDSQRVGSFGFCVKKLLKNDSPANALRALLLSKQTPVFTFGQLQGVKKFIYNQFQLRF